MGDSSGKIRTLPQEVRETMAVSDSGVTGYGTSPHTQPHRKIFLVKAPIFLSCLITFYLISEQSPNTPMPPIKPEVLKASRRQIIKL